ncbi:MAG TPA: 2'-deoxycytidine 5'-triphosphate deaminase [Gammaproteobacteria bacterium]|nr:2'-deoxycytidine 5'-triphosphate deaminase [Gammaproteobacteria bacterium]
MTMRTADLFEPAELAEARRPAQQAAGAAGVLPSQAIEGLISTGAVQAVTPVQPGQIQPASLDLRLGNVAYQVRSSFLPGRHTPVRAYLERLNVRTLDLSSRAVLQKGRVYIVPLQEALHLPPAIQARANPKSTTGRLDILCRLLTEHGEAFDDVPPGYAGQLYAEIFPRTFAVYVRAGSRLNQMRFSTGQTTSDREALTREHAAEPVVLRADGRPAARSIRGNSVFFSVALADAGNGEFVGYRARQNRPLIDIDALEAYEPGDFWEPIRARPSRSLVLEPNEFYILASREFIRIPPSFAAEMVAYDPSLGEFRVHYAGFFDPGFGWGDANKTGSRAVLEVRSHEVPFLLEDGQPVGRLVFEPLAERPDRTYGKPLGSYYNFQNVALGKQFRRPP